VEAAIALTSQDFSVHDGIRTAAEQKVLFNSGASKTMNSKHLRQADGFGAAVDLVPYVNGKLRWEWPLIYPIAAAMALCARDQGVNLRWGGAWDRSMSSFLGNTTCVVEAAVKMEREVAAYIVRHPGPDFIDGPHYELLD
jgi:peptidoglycan L-alanyl-D-glutamate endopeptidase CwlK